VQIGVCSSLWVALYLSTALSRSKLAPTRFAIQRVAEVCKGPHFHPFNAKNYARLEFWGICSKDQCF
jgi:hypothetical protein